MNLPSLHIIQETQTPEKKRDLNTIIKTQSIIYLKVTVSHSLQEANNIKSFSYMPFAKPLVSGTIAKTVAKRFPKAVPIG